MIVTVLSNTLPEGDSVDEELHNAPSTVHRLRALTAADRALLGRIGTVLRLRTETDRSVPRPKAVCGDYRTNPRTAVGPYPCSTDPADALWLTTGLW